MRIKIILLKKRGDFKKCSLSVAVSLLCHVALVSLACHHATPSPLFEIFMVEKFERKISFVPLTIKLDEI